MSQNTFVGLHVPKCAGTSFLEMALSALPRNQVYQTTSIIRNWQEKQPEFFDMYDRSGIRVIWGHSVHEQMLHYVNNPVLFTGLRDPVERLVSEARYQVDLRARQGQQPMDVPGWVSSQVNPMCWFIINRFPTLAQRSNQNLNAFEKAREALRSFDHVYFTETFAESANVVFSSLGLDVEVKEANVGKLRSLDVDIDTNSLRFDIQLYEWAREEFRDRKFELGAPKAPAMQAFLSGQPNPEVLEDFLFRQQAGEYASWNAIDDVIEARLTVATRLMKEIAYYRAKRVRA